MRLRNLLPLIILLASCSVPPAATPTGTETGQPASEGSTFQPTATARLSTLPAPGLPASTSVPSTGVPLVLTVFSPLDNAVVEAAQINLTGNVSREATMTVNNDIYLLATGDFSIPLILDEGPNALEIVASDSDGNETDLVLVVTYQP